MKIKNEIKWKEDELVAYYIDKFIRIIKKILQGIYQ